jgi:hypothetical protein
MNEYAVYMWVPMRVCVYVCGGVCDIVFMCLCGKWELVWFYVRIRMSIGVFV